jgi:hypothetical protein
MALLPSREGNDELGVSAWFGLHIDLAAMLLDDDVVGHRETETCPFRSPATPKTNEPVQTDVTYFELAPR